MPNALRCQQDQQLHTTPSSRTQAQAPTPAPDPRSNSNHTSTNTRTPFPLSLSTSSSIPRPTHRRSRPSATSAHRLSYLSEIPLHRLGMNALITSPIRTFVIWFCFCSLSKRFTLLRSANGNTVNLDDLRYRFAEQRAKGAEYQISEEEEDMLLDMLSRIRAQGGANAKLVSKGPTSNGPIPAPAPMRPEPSQQSLSSTEGTSTASSTVRQSAQSTTTLSSAGGYGYEPSQSSPVSPSTPTTRNKRHSNQLFAGGQLRDLRSMRKTSNRTISSNRSALSTTPSESTSGSVANALIDFYSDSGAGRPSSPENEHPSPPLSATSSPVSPLRNSSISSAEDILGPLPGTVGLRVRKELTNNQIQRISMSLDDALKEMEEEAEDQVLVPRTSQALASANGSATAVTVGEKNAFALTTDDVRPLLCDLSPFPVS